MSLQTKKSQARTLYFYRKITSFNKNNLNANPDDRPMIKVLVGKRKAFLKFT